jgi:hypothetical protein
LINLLLPVINVPEKEFQKTHDDLDYRPAKLEVILTDCFQWMQAEKMINTTKVIKPVSNSKPETLAIK